MEQLISAYEAISQGTFEQTREGNLLAAILLELGNVVESVLLAIGVHGGLRLRSMSLDRSSWLSMGVERSISFSASVTK